MFINFSIMTHNWINILNPSLILKHSSQHAGSRAARSTLRVDTADEGLIMGDT
jgi:hypothetical protein